MRQAQLLTEVVEDLAGPVAAVTAAYVGLIDQCVTAGQTRGLARLDLDEMLRTCGLDQVIDLTDSLVEIDRYVSAALDR